MPATPHVEQHFAAAEAVRDVVIGMSDGLTVPFALAAGLAGAVAATKVVVVAGMAEIAAGSIAMGLGGYLAARTDAEHYANEQRRESDEIDHLADRERDEVATVFRDLGLAEEQVGTVTAAVCSDRTRWLDFMMRFELGLEAPEPGRARRSALTIALSYVLGGMVPLSPYLVFATLGQALVASVVLTLLALVAFGAVKARFTGINPLRGAGQTLLVGGLAAGAAYALARLLG